jgi:single-stranded-DNA-specific exonuclease
MLGPDGDQEPMTIVAGPWPPGIVGLVAGRLADQLGRPAIVFSTTAEPWRGSARSAGDVDLGATFTANAELFERYGGHAAAAGCHLAPERYEAFRAAMRAVVVGRPESPAAEPSVGPRRRTLALDLAVSAGSVDHLLLADLLPLDGAGDEPPVLGIAGLSVSRIRLANGGHTQLTLRKGTEVLDAICFGRADLAETIREGDVVDVAARLTSRSFGGYETLQLEVRDVAPAGSVSRLWAASREPADTPVEIMPTPMVLAS